MDRDKQIEEVAKEFCPLFKEYGTCETCDAILDIGDNPCVHKSIASIIIAHDYRKTSEVAEEIIGMLKSAGIDEWRYPVIAEIKEKYAENEDVKSIYKHYTASGAAYITSEPKESEGTE